MRTVVIFRARMGSTRLPGKVMADLMDRPLLARQYGAEAFAGSEQDVLDRYYQAAGTFGADVIVRLTADCPLLDPRVSERVIARFQQGDVD
jgi:spore coat polysaccharide biosynthesis protein SpsF (cytidylyltransferase family)